MGPLLPCRMPNEQPAESIAARRTPVHCRRSSGPWDQRPLVGRRHVTRHEVSGPCAHASFDLEWPRPAGAQTVCTVEGTGWLGFYYGASEIRSMSAYDVRKEGSDRAVRGAGRPPHVPMGGGLPLQCRLVLRVVLRRFAEGALPATGSPTLDPHGITFRGWAHRRRRGRPRPAPLAVSSRCG